MLARHAHPSRSEKVCEDAFVAEHLDLNLGASVIRYRLRRCLDGCLDVRRRLGRAVHHDFEGSGRAETVT